MDLEQARVEIKGHMVKYCGIVRNGKHLRWALGQVKHIFNWMQNRKLDSIRAMEVYNMAQVSVAIIEDAERRQVSVGGHFRSDEE